MRKFIISLSALLCIATFGRAQSPADTAVHPEPVVIRIVSGSQVVNTVHRQKTMASWDLLGLLYQLSLDDVTADDKSLGFKSTIEGLRLLFNKNAVIKNVERYIEPNLAWHYQNEFRDNNLTAGVNFSIVNKNDPKASPLFNGPNPVATQLHQMVPDLEALRQRMKSHIPTQVDVATHNTLESLVDSLMQVFVNTGDPSVFDINTQWKQDAQTPVTVDGNSRMVIAEVKAFNDAVKTVAARIKRGWNLVFAPNLTYAFNHQQLQGYNLAIKGQKGFASLLGNDKRTSQFVFKAGFHAGDDSIVKTIKISRQQWQAEFGFNQVFVTRKIKDDDGSPVDAPAVELAITGGYNRIVQGLLPDEKNGQPVINLKLGVLVGKQSWLVFPFTYNFATKEARATFSVKVNIGDPPFK